MIKQFCMVEDDPIQHFFLSKLLDRIPFEGERLFYSDGKTAFEMLESRTKSGQPLPDLVLLDINMPVWNGWDFLEHYKALDGFNKQSIYILTSSINPDDKRNAEYFGLQNQYISKPLKSEQIIEIIEDLTKSK